MSLPLISPHSAKGPSIAARDKVARYVGRKTARAPGGVTLTEVAQDLGLKQAEAYDLLCDLEARGVLTFALDRVMGGGWRLTHNGFIT